MDALSQKLFVIFQNVNEWLKFAETKNAVLLAFSGTGMAAIFTLLSTVQNLPNSLRIGLLISTFLLCSCSLICALSFLPKINLDRMLWVTGNRFQAMAPQAGDNLYYYGHLKKYNAQTLSNAINTSYLNGGIAQPYGKESQDLATQITINAEIAFRKYRYFTCAAYCLSASIIVVPAFALLSLIFNRGL
jgi:hypothetical protein